MDNILRKINDGPLKEQYDYEPKILIERIILMLPIGDVETIVNGLVTGYVHQGDDTPLTDTINDIVYNLIKLTVSIENHLNFYGVRNHIAFFSGWHNNAVLFIEEEKDYESIPKVENKKKLAGGIFEYT